MKIEVAGIQYLVRGNFLHRGQNPRLVLEEKSKIDGRLLAVQFDNNDKVLNDLANMGRNDKPMFDGKYYTGYWCHNAEMISIKILEQ